MKELTWSEIDELEEIVCGNKSCNNVFRKDENKAMTKESEKAGWLITSYSRKIYCPNHRLN